MLYICKHIYYVFVLYYRGVSTDMSVCVWSVWSVWSVLSVLSVCVCVCVCVCVFMCVCVYETHIRAPCLGDT